MKVNLLLADHADAVGGKLYINGGGWNVTGPQPVPSAIALLIEVPWDQTNEKHDILLELLDVDGNAVEVLAPDGSSAPLKVESVLEVGRPPGVKPGTPLNAPLAVNFGPIPLEPGSQYVWHLSIDGHSEEDWNLTFSTRPIPPQSPAAQSERGAE
jgi:Family of unknown function (DUF6941)